MKFEYSGRHIEVTRALKTHVEDHFKKIEHIFKGKPAKAHVIIEVERSKHKAEIIVQWRNETLAANSSNSDMYLSLSQSISKIEKQALKLKNKVIDKSHKAKKVSKLPDMNAVESDEPAASKAIKTRRYSVKPMTSEEAVMELEGSADSFVVFRNADTEKLAVLYERKDGNYGLIES